EAALQVFKVSKQLVRLQEHADLLPHVERLRRMNRFARRRAKSPAEPQQQQPQPQLQKPPS
ncbi:MAG TPA: hypothetical protein VNI54_16220, partial [Thermoanaerobaculia bacterium]|nr:hypothetical protein [Thermoanaerobaculia bacterium]